MGVALPSDELRLGVKDLSDDELAGSLRNTFRREASNVNNVVQHWASELSKSIKPSKGDLVT